MQDIEGGHVVGDERMFVSGTRRWKPAAVGNSGERR